MVCAVAITAVGTSQALHGAPQEQQQGDPLIDMATKEKVATQAGKPHYIILLHAQGSLHEVNTVHHILLMISQAVV